MTDENSDVKFNRAGFDEWLNILKDERNPKLLCDAIEAVTTLARNDEEALIAAKACLVAARTYGRFSFPERSSQRVGFEFQTTTQAQISYQFMDLLGRMYPMLAPLPAIQAIDLELNANHEHSIEACTALLYQMKRQVIDPAVVESKLGQETLNSIAVSLKRLAGETIPRDAVQEYRIKLAYLTDQSIENESDLIAYLAGTIEKLKGEQVTFPFYSSMLYAAWDTKRLDDIPVNQAARAIIGSESADGFVDRLRDKDSTKLLAWYKDSALFDSFYEAMLVEFQFRPKICTSVIEDFLVEQATDPNAVCKTIQDTIDRLPKSGEPISVNGETRYIHVDPTERAAQLVYLNRVIDRLSKRNATK